MYLELAENCASCLSENDLIPVVDDETGEVFMMNVAAVANLDPADQMEIMEQAPILLYILEKDNFNGMEGKLWDNIKNKVGNFFTKVRNTLTGGNSQSGVSPMPAPTPEEFFNSQSQTPGQRSLVNWGVQAGTTEKPWYAQPEVIWPIIGVAGLGIFLLTKK